MSLIDQLSYYLSRALLKSITLYKQHISPHKGYQCHCRQHGMSSCSSHAMECLESNTLPQALTAIRQRLHYCRSLSSTTPKQNLTKLTILGASLVLVTGCGGGGGGGGDSSGGTDSGTDDNSAKSGQLVLNDTSQPLGSVAYNRSTTASAQSTSATTTNTSGNFTYNANDSISFTLGKTTFGPIDAKSVITADDLSQALCADNNDLSCENNSRQNIINYANSLDDDNDASNGFNLTKNTDAVNTSAALDFTQNVDNFSADLGDVMKELGLSPTLGFGQLTVAGKPLSGLQYSTKYTDSNNVLHQDNDLILGDDGQYTYPESGTIIFTLNGEHIGPLAAVNAITEKELASSLCADKTDPYCTYNAEKNLQVLAKTTDNNANDSDGYQLPDNLNNLPDLSTGIDVFRAALEQQDYTVASLFTPSLGINLEEPQPESDTVGGQAVPFADLFRIARPFTEYSCTDIEYDTNGWPTAIPESCASGSNEFLQSATTTMLRNVPDGAIPEGQYNVFFEGKGTLKFSGLVHSTTITSSGAAVTVQVTGSSATNRSSGIRMQITQTDASDPIRNIRVVMPGGICTDKPWKRVSDSAACPDSEYKHFTTELQADRNAILFNPDFLASLKDFKVLRTMNFMKASPRKWCGGEAQEYLDCLFTPLTWDERGKMEHAVWGGSGVTPIQKRYGKGTPLEVIIALANALKIDPWFNIPHSADDDYVTQFATQVHEQLDSNLTAYVEYSNETWNGIFQAAEYVRKKGTEEKLSMQLGTSTVGWVDEETVNETWTGAFYTAKRSKEIFTIWESVFGDISRLKRILGSYYANEYITRNMLDYENTKTSVDAVAIAPYFQACWQRSTNLACEVQADESLQVKHTMAELAQSGLTQEEQLNALFETLQDNNNPYSVPNIVQKIKDQHGMTEPRGVDLVAYEGGQHLVVNWGDTGSGKNDVALSRDQKDSLLALNQTANRDPRMADLYLQLLNGWKDNGGELFVIYTMPQSYHQWGSFGIKEHLNMPRNDSPKYHGLMRFQESVVQPWF